MSSVFKIIRAVSEKGGNTLGKITKQQKNADKAAEKTTESQAQKTRSYPSENAFQEQIPKLTAKLLGNRIPSSFKFIGRFIPDSLSNNITDVIFLRIALLAQKWSQFDLPSDYQPINRSGVQPIYTEAEKASFAKSIADENRAFAATGSGITGLTGVVGTIADLLWLLLLSLRMIYQTSDVYGKPLRGNEGAKTAFDILSKADLSILTEKQAVLISMNAAGEIVDDIDLQVLEGLVKSDGDIAFIREAISSFAEQLNISFNMSWLLKFLPVASGLTSAVYSVYIVNEISAVIMAEFANQTDDTETVD